MNAITRDFEDTTYRQKFDATQSGDPLHPPFFAMAVQDRDAAVLHDWQPISTAPFEHDLQLSVIEQGEVHALAFPCRRTANGWMDAATRKPVSVDPTHWREWPNRPSS
jgi:hypothetical protein